MAIPVATAALPGPPAALSPRTEHEELQLESPIFPLPVAPLLRHPEISARKARIEGIHLETYPLGRPSNAFLRVHDSKYCFPLEGGRYEVVDGYYAKLTVEGKPVFRRIQHDGTIRRHGNYLQEISLRGTGLWWFRGFEGPLVPYDSWYATHVTNAPMSKEDFLQVPPATGWSPYSCDATDHVLQSPERESLTIEILSGVG